jgi:hypothetical protein
VKVDLVPGITPVSVRSVDETARELDKLMDNAHEVAEIAHRMAAALVAVVNHPNADPALLFGMVAPTVAPVGPDDAAALRRHLTDVGDIQDVVDGRTPGGCPVVFAERVVTPERLRVGEPFDCQMQAVVADPRRARIAVFTLSSATGRGWLDLSALFGRMVATVAFNA